MSTMRELDPVRQEEIDQLRERLAMYRRTLAHLLLQAAAYGGEIFAPPQAAEGIYEARANIKQLKDALRELGQEIEDHFDDISVVEQAQSQFEQLPVSVVPRIAPLPKGSRIRLASNPLFVGREPALRQLAGMIKGDEAERGHVKVVAISGIGGVGKTQLASEFVHRYGQYFADVFWLDFEHADHVPAEIAACGGAGAMELAPDFNSQPLDAQLARVLAAWNSPLPRLLVFDNCEDQRLLARWRPTTGSCRILVTSRSANVNPALGLTRLRLDVLERPASIALLRQHCQQCPDIVVVDTTLGAIAQELGDMPLALHLAGRFLTLYHNSVTPDEYLAELRHPDLLEHPSMQGEEGDVEPTGHVLHVARTFALSYERLDPSSPIDALARLLLGRAEYFWRFASGDPVAQRLLLMIAVAQNPAQAALRQADRALGRLIELGLIETIDGRALPLHNLLASFVRAVAPDQAPRAPVIQALCEYMRSGHIPAADRRAAAHLLIRLDWMADTPELDADALLDQLDLIAYTVDSPIQRPYLIESINRLLPSADPRRSPLDQRQRVQLLRYRAMLQGQMGDLATHSEDAAIYIDRAAADYECASTIIDELIERDGGKSDDLKMAARVKIGAGTAARIQAERLNAPRDGDNRQKGLESATRLYVAAGAYVQRYGPDPALQLTIYRELIYTCALQGNWDAAVTYYRATMHALKDSRAQTEDEETYALDLADVLDAAGNLHWRHGRELAGAPDRAPALREYKKAYYLARKAVRALITCYTVSEPLVIAHYNAGKYRVAIGECSEALTQPMIDESCRDWQTALHMARTLGMAEMERKAASRIQRYCGAAASGGS